MTNSSAVQKLLFDEPIAESENDVLGMRDSARSMARYCLRQDSSIPFVVGVYGEWGSGKTSFTNLVKEGIRVETENLPDKDKPVLLSFDPWACDPSEPMLRRYLNELASSLSKGAAATKKAKKVASRLKDYAEAAAPAVPIPGLAGVAGAALGAFAESGSTIEALKGEVS